MERLVGTISRGIRAPIIREGDDIAAIVVDSVLAAAKSEGFALRDRQQRPVAGVDTLGVKLAEGDLGKMRFVFDRIYVSGLSALFEMTPEGNNLAALMKSPAAETASPTTVSASAATNPAPEAAPRSGS